MPTYDVGDIIGKTLIARIKVAVYRTPVDSATPMGYVAPGSPVGVVYSYLLPNVNYGRSKMYWVFYDAQQQQYYTIHDPAFYDLTNLKQQGVLTVEEKLAAEELAAAPWYERLIRKYGIWILGAVVVAGAVRGLAARPARPQTA